MNEKLMLLRPDSEDIFEKKCFAFPTKRRYGSEASAWAMIERMHGEARLKSYHCRSCEGWHLASVSYSYY